MLKLFTFLLFFTFNESFANLEHGQGVDPKPTTAKLKFTRGCFSEIQELGCPHPKESSEIFRTCLDQKIELLSLDCQTFFQRLYRPKKN